MSEQKPAPTIMPMQPPKPIAVLTIELGDRNRNGRADLTSTLAIADQRVVGPVTIDAPQAQALSFLTGLFDGAHRGLVGMAVSTIGAILPTLFGERGVPFWVRGAIDVIEHAAGVAGDDHQG